MEEEIHKNVHEKVHEKYTKSELYIYIIYMLFI